MIKCNIFCDKCNLLSSINVCRACGKKDLRKPEEDDVCFLVLLNSLNAKMLEFELEEAKIKNVLMPV